MTDQNTPLKTKAKTLAQWCIDYREIPSGTPDYLIKEWTKELVLLSDAEPLELENQQLKNEIFEWQCESYELNNLYCGLLMQIEIFTRWLQEQIYSLNEYHDDEEPPLESILSYEIILKKFLEVFGGKTET